MSAFLARLREANARLVRLVDTVVGFVEIRRRAQLVVAVTLAGIVAAFTGGLLASASLARHRWSNGVNVLVAASPIAAGATIDSSNTRTVVLPPALSPADALATPPASSRARVALAPGTPVTSSLVDSGDVLDPPTGWRVVAVPGSTVAPVLHSGDVVDVVALDTVLCTGALVVATRDGVVVSVAVPAESVAVVATAMHSGDASLVLARRAG